MSAGIGALFPDAEVIAAGDGQQALELIERGVPDLVLTDLDMPGMDGFELTRQLNATHPDLPVIVISGRESPTVAGARLVIKKPISPMTLKAEILDVLAAD